MYPLKMSIFLETVRLQLRADRSPVEPWKRKVSSIIVPHFLACGNVYISESEEGESEEGENMKDVGRQVQRAKSDEARLVLIPIILSADNRPNSPVNTRRTPMKKKKRSPN
jgi:hypothetical protein